jgi:hypothetical protein
MEHRDTLDLEIISLLTGRLDGRIEVRRDGLHAELQAP